MKILKFPELQQAYCWDCGANAMQSILAYYNIDVREQIVMKLAKTTKSGTPISGMKKVVKKYGLNFKASKMTIEDIKKYLDKKIPVILLVQAWPDKKNTNWEKDWADNHYVTAIGYDRKKIYFEDPWKTVRTYLAFDEFQKRWHGIDSEEKKYINWGMAVFGKKLNFNPSKSIHMD